MKPGTRVRFNEGSAWPERVGCRGVVVDPAVFKGVYPGDKRMKFEVIVLLDKDPLNTTSRGWTCVASDRSLDVLAYPERGED